MIIINIIQALLIALWTLFTVYVVGGLTTQNAAFKFVKRNWSKGIAWILLSKITVKGKEKIDENKHYIFMANHSSYFDIPCLFLATDRRLHFMAKDELRTNPFSGFMLKKIEMIFIDRSSAQKSTESIRKAIQFIQKGRNVAIFPEGTRTKNGKLGPLKRGGFKLAISSQTEIVPVTIQHSARAWPVKNFPMKPSRVVVEFHSPISVSGMKEEDASELMKEVKNVLTTN